MPRIDYGDICQTGTRTSIACKASFQLREGPREPSCSKGSSGRPRWYVRIGGQTGRIERSSRTLRARHQVQRLRTSSPATAITWPFLSCTPRLKNVFTKLNLDYEIIFVNDCSPDDTEEVIARSPRSTAASWLSSYSRILAIRPRFAAGWKSLRRIPGSARWRSSRSAGPLEAFVAKWAKAIDVVYGTRVKREATLLMRLAYKLFTGS